MNSDQLRNVYRCKYLTTTPNTEARESRQLQSLYAVKMQVPVCSDVLALFTTSVDDDWAAFSDACTMHPLRIPFALVSAIARSRYHIGVKAPFLGQRP